jgi:hypothetical protein
MIMNKIVVAAAGILLCFVVASFGQDDLKPWEKYGLSQTEWKMVQDNKIPTSKVEELLGAGISVGEYIKKPWKDLGLTEGDWIEKHRNGLSSYDIELEMNATGHAVKSDTANKP